MHLLYLIEVIIISLMLYFEEVFIIKYKFCWGKSIGDLKIRKR